VVLRTPCFGTTPNGIMRGWGRCPMGSAPQIPLRKEVGGMDDKPRKRERRVREWLVALSPYAAPVAFVIIALIQVR
jgi:hypothetical protein